MSEILPPTGAPQRAHAEGGGGGGGGSSSSNSSSGAVPQDALANTVRRPRFQDAVDETALKLLLQAAKPINTFLYGAHDLEQKFTGMSLTGGEGAGVQRDLVRRVRELRFAELRAVRLDESCDILNLEDLAGGVLSLPLFATPLSQAAREALGAGFRSALERKVACWEGLRAALRAQPSGGRAAAPAGVPRRAAAGVAARSGSGAGQRVLEVLEVERWSPGGGEVEWWTPWLPTDGELAWRWVDATGVRHPQLERQLPRAEASARKTPPCRPDALFRPVSDWAVETGPGTDGVDGWQYGLAWTTATWEPQQGLFNALRRRRWTRTFA